MYYGNDNRKKIAVTSYGRGTKIDRMAVSLFDGETDAATYCDTINALELKEDAWVFAQVIPENTPFFMNKFVKEKNFAELLLSLDDYALQKVMREVDSQELAKALKGEEAAVQEKIFRNMSKRAAAMLKEDMDFMGPIGSKYVRESQTKIISVIFHLRETGEIVLAGIEEMIV